MKTADDYKVEDTINNIRYNRKLDDATKHTIINKIKEEQSYSKWVDKHNEEIENTIKNPSTSTTQNISTTGAEVIGYFFSNNTPSSKDDTLLDNESLFFISGNTAPIVTSLFTLYSIASAAPYDKCTTQYLTLLACAGTIGLRCVSKFLSAKEKKAQNKRLTDLDELKIIMLSTAHLSAFAALAYVAFTSFEKALGPSCFKNEALIVSSACCAYQLAAIGLKKAKLHVREG